MHSLFTSQLYCNLVCTHTHTWTKYNFIFLRLHNGHHSLNDHMHVCQKWTSTDVYYWTVNAGCAVFWKRSQSALFCLYPAKTHTPLLWRALDGIMSLPNFQDEPDSAQHVVPRHSRGIIVSSGQGREAHMEFMDCIIGVVRTSGALVCVFVL